MPRRSAVTNGYRGEYWDVQPRPPRSPCPPPGGGRWWEITVMDVEKVAVSGKHTVSFLLCEDIQRSCVTQVTLRSKPRLQTRSWFSQTGPSSGSVYGTSPSWELRSCDTVEPLPPVVGHSRAWRCGAAINAIADAISAFSKHAVTAARLQLPV